jgi:serine/threonine-protein kinase
VADSPSAGFLHPYFTLVRELGHGALTSTYEALDMHPRMHGRRFALKVLRRREHCNWFLRIGRATAALCHPSIVACHEVAEFEGWMYIALDFVPGTSLSQEIAGGTRWSDEDVVRIVRDVGTALDCAHAQGIVHGHVHPKHILLTADRQPQVIGFGEYPPPEGCFFGNPLQLAPEQLMDETRVTPRTDVFALSEIAFWMLTGKHPYAGPRAAEQLAAKSKGTCQSLRQLRPDLSVAVDNVLRRGMAPKPEDRFPSAGELSESLAPALAAESPQKKWWRLWS